MKLPVAFTLGNRLASLDKDALMKNALAEGDETVMRARKRPSVDSAFTAATGTGQALFNWNIPGAPENGPTEFLVSITDDTLTVGPSPINKSLAFTVEPS